MAAFANLRYERWVKERRAMVDELSRRPGRLPPHQGDGPALLARFKKDLAEFRHKEALVIDQRWNGGGNIEQELLAILVQRPYQVWQPRGTEPTPRPFAGYFGPKVVLQNWRSASNAEMFPAGFRALGPRQGDRHPDDGRRDRHRQLLADRRLDDPDARRRRLPRRRGAGPTWRTPASSPTSSSRTPPRTTSPAATASSKSAVKEVMKGLKPDSDVAGRE